MILEPKNKKAKKNPTDLIGLKDKNIKITPSNPY
ncbi:hypothetical protein SMU68_10033 [Streptococcus mutans NFSM1]|nr:hypothetical protein SMU68_10033 [Streptococcus mutans NFSM1]